MNAVPTEEPRYRLGDDIDLDDEVVRRPDGTRLTEQAAAELAEEAVAQYLPSTRG